MGWRVGLDSFGSKGTSTLEPLAILRCRPPTQLVANSGAERRYDSSKLIVDSKLIVNSEGHWRYDYPKLLVK